MTSQNKIIDALRNEFLQEANSAPKLFKDLAKVEQYIAESYKTRSFIELIQNADDAKSTDFGVHSFSNGLIVANNGNPFTIEDVEALCRSGSSNKFRGSHTIGYRGIGFKSVVNLAESIYVFSGEFAFYFDKDTTKKLLPDIPDAPLIRIPHLFEAEKNETLLKEVDSLRGKHKYTTLFVFVEIHKRIAEEELSGFDRSSLLFLNNIRKVHFELENIERTINVGKPSSINQNSIKLSEADYVDEWEILHSKNDQKDMVALKRQDDSIVPALPAESVIHSFTPTVEFAGAHIKINGDYTTDPSRKNVDMDEISHKSFENAVYIIIDTVVEILEGKTVKKGFFSPFVNVSGREGNKFRGLLFKALSDKLNKKTLHNFNGKTVAFSAIRLRPDWLNYEDYEKLCHSELAYLSKKQATLYPELPAFLEQLGIKKLYLDDTVEKVNTTRISNAGAGQIVTKVINQHRYDLNTEKVKHLKTLKVFPVKDKLVSADEVQSIEEIDKEFTDYILNNADQHDIKHFFSKLNVSVESRLPNKTITPEKSSMQMQQPQDEINAGEARPEIFKVQPNIQKWRSAEKNAQEYLSSLADVLSVTDVSTANMGYDLEVLFTNGKKIYVEIKSVSSFSESVKITNNEYSSAHSYGSSYYLAIVINDEPFQIKLIPDPIKNLSFQKQIERWSWFCENYKDQLVAVENIL